MTYNIKIKEQQPKQSILNPTLKKADDTKQNHTACLKVASDMTISDFNRVAIKMLGFRQSDKSTLLFSKSEVFDFKSIQQNIVSASTQRRTSSIETTLTDGTPCKVLLKPEGDGDIKVLISLPTELDTFKKYKLEHTPDIQNNEKTLELLYTQSQLGIATVDMDFNYKQVNERFCDMIGYTREELLEMTAQQISHPNDFNNCVNKVKDILEGKTEMIGLEKRFIKKDGSFLTVNLHIHSFFNTNENQLEFITTLEDISEKIEAIKALKASEAFHKNIIRNLKGHGVMLFDKDLRYYYAEGEELRKYGYTKEVVLGKTVYEVVPEKATADFLGAQYKRVLNGETIDFENQYRNDYHYVRLSPTYDEKNNITGGMVSFNDITKTKLINKAINYIANDVAHSSDEDFFKDVVKHVAEYLDVEYAFIGSLNSENDSVTTKSFWANGKYLENISYNLQGTPCNHVVGKSVYAFPNDVQALFPNDQDLVDLKAEGYIGVPLFDINDNPLGLLVVMDTKPILNVEIAKSIMKVFAARISAELERMKAQSELRESERLFRNMYEYSPVGVVMSSLKGEMLRTNKRFCDMLGYEAGELDGTHVRDISHEIDYALEGEFADKLMSKQIDCYSLEKRFVRKDGTIMWGNMSLSVTRTVDGEIEHIIAMIEDITDRKTAQNALIELNSTLERKVRERTNALKTSNEELSRFAYVASHDMKQPLRTVASFAKLLERKYSDVLDDGGKQYLNFITSGIHNMDNLITGLLNYANNTSQSAVLFETVDLKETVEVVLQNLKQQVEESDVEVTYSNLPSAINGVRIKIQQLVQNLVSNALKFKSDDRKSTIHISAIETPTHWQISVKDNGIGIRQEDKEAIFQLFKKLNGATHEGSGIGLATCKGIVNQHNGEIWVNSTYGEGSEFLFTILK